MFALSTLGIDLREDTIQPNIVNPASNTISDI